MGKLRQRLCDQLPQHVRVGKRLCDQPICLHLVAERVLAGSELTINQRRQRDIYIGGVGVEHCGGAGIERGVDGEDEHDSFYYDFAAKIRVLTTC